MNALEDQIANWMRQADATGELKGHPGYGKPIEFDDGFDQTPPELRMAYKVLKNAGYAPAEVEMMRDLAALRQNAAAAPEGEEKAVLQKQINHQETKLALALEAMKELGR